MNVPQPSSESLLSSVLNGYAGRGHGYDELTPGDGQTRPQWQTFLDHLGRLGLDGFRHHWHEAKQLIRENGVTYNVYGDPRGLDRPWQLDPIPLIISAAEGERLREGLVQRARLLEAILVDLYGPQRMLQSAGLPAELVFANRGFLRPCHGVSLPGQRYLHLVAVDVGRGADGTIVALGDRTQAPSGAGYALENRIVLARMLPEVFRACKVQRLALFFRTFRDALRNLAWHNRDNPRIVLLTPGPDDETYFEHAYLARYLGFTLAEGSDLTVRDQRVYLKLLDGLLPVDVVWRRMSDELCDPLELRHDSLVGVPGLVQAVRAGNVAVANALGSGLAESAAWIPYLPALCQSLLGEDLLIPSAPAYWCGEAQACAHVLANLPRLVIKAAFPPIKFEPIFPLEMTEEQRRHLQEQIRARPWAYVGQEILNLSTTPVFADTRLQPRPMVVRTYLAAHESSFMLMPGGLTRVTGGADTMVVSLQQGGGSKDTWVLTEGPVHEFSLLRPSGQAADLSRGGNDLPSRAADNLFWLGRYVQRAEDMVRLLRGIFVRLTEKAGLADVPELPMLLRALTHLTQTLPGFLVDDGTARLAAPRDELFSLVFQSERVGSLAFNFQAIHRSAGSVRDRISMDMWRILSSLSLDEALPADTDATLSDVLDLLDQRVIALAGFGGIAMESMTRGHGWRFLDMGRKIERAQHTAGLLHCTLTVPSTSEIPLLEALLEIADSSMTYRRRYLGNVHAAPVLDLLLVDESNPRALVFQLQALHDVIEQLPKDPTLVGRSPEQRLILTLLSGVQLADIKNLSKVDQGRRKNLDDFLTWLEEKLPALADLVSQRYLSHLQKSRQLAAGAGQGGGAG